MNLNEFVLGLNLPLGDWKVSVEAGRVKFRTSFFACCEGCIKDGTVAKRSYSFLEVTKG